MIYSHQLDRTVAEVLEHVVTAAIDDGLDAGVRQAREPNEEDS